VAGARIELVVPADEPALFFASIAQAERYLEPIDVKNGVIGVAFGRLGEPYRVSDGGDAVVIEAVSDQPDQPERLRAVLVAFLFAIGEPPSEADDLNTLLARCELYCE
jgi:hypothetical protein